MTTEPAGSEAPAGPESLTGFECTVAASATAEADVRRHTLKFWQAECLRAGVLAAGMLTVGGAVALLVMGVLASGGARPELQISGILLFLVVAHCLAQIWLGVLGFRSAMRWIAARSPKGAL